jgi:hypothetical protein
MKHFVLILVSCICAFYAPAQTSALLEPPDGCVYHGAQLMDFDPGNKLSGYLGALNDASIHPAVRGLFFSIPGERGPDNSFKALIELLQDADALGYIPELSLFLVDQQGATDSIIAVSTVHDWIIDSIITLCKNYGRKMFLRIGGEFNGAGPGWNGGGYHPHYYVTMFRKIVDRFSQRGLRDSIAVNWCYEPDAANDFDAIDAQGYRWYPGDDYVDWFGLDVFASNHFDQSLPDSIQRNITPKGKSERFLKMAREKGKPVFLSETSAKGINISADSADGVQDWDDWFVKFWHFMDVHPEIKGFCYINANWPAGAYPGWGDARIQNSAYVSGRYAEELRKPRYIHAHGVGCLPAAVPEAAVAAPTLSIYPNPAKDLVTIRAPYGSIVHIVDVTGKTVYQSYVSETPLLIGTAGLGDGVYTVRLIQAGHAVCGKLVVVH